MHPRVYAFRFASMFPCMNVYVCNYDFKQLNGPLCSLLSRMQTSRAVKQGLPHSTLSCSVQQAEHPLCMPRAPSLYMGQCHTHTHTHTHTHQTTHSPQCTALTTSHYYFNNSLIHLSVWRLIHLFISFFMLVVGRGGVHVCVCVPADGGVAGLGVEYSSGVPG